MAEVRTPLKEALATSSGGFDVLLQTIQSETNRIAQSQAVAKQLANRKNLSLFQSDLNFETERRKIEQLSPLKQEAAVNQARALGEVEKDIYEFRKDLEKKTALEIAEGKLQQELDFKLDNIDELLELDDKQWEQTLEQKKELWGAEAATELESLRDRYKLIESGELPTDDEGGVTPTAQDSNERQTRQNFMQSYSELYAEGVPVPRIQYIGGELKAVIGEESYSIDDAHQKYQNAKRIVNEITDFKKQIPDIARSVGVVNVDPEGEKFVSVETGKAFLGPQDAKRLFDTVDMGKVFAGDKNEKMKAESIIGQLNETIFPQTYSESEKEDIEQFRTVSGKIKVLGDKLRDNPDEAVSLVELEGALNSNFGPLSDLKPKESDKLKENIENYLAMYNNIIGGTVDKSTLFINFDYNRNTDSDINAFTQANSNVIKPGVYFNRSPEEELNETQKIMRAFGSGEEIIIPDSLKNK